LIKEPIVDIDAIVTQRIPPYYSALRPTLLGANCQSNLRIPFFQAVISGEDAAREFGLADEVPTDLRSKWLLTRVGALDDQLPLHVCQSCAASDGNPGKLKFFNSLTVALLPLDSRRMLAKEYGATPHEPEVKQALRTAPFRVINVGGVQVIVNNDTPHGYIRWDPKRIFPATIDGQHRLAALREHYIHGNLTAEQLSTKISVLFLVLDERVGFQMSGMELTEDDNPILTVVREVFIDLSKHAKEVERARRILLDDQDIESRCLREMLATRVGEVQEGRLPLGIVHWQHNVTAKFNVGKPTGPFVTTVELLFSILSDLLDLKRPKDPLDEAQVRKLVNSIEAALRVSDLIAAHPSQYGGLKPLMTYVERKHLRPDDEVPFANLPASYLRVAAEGFNQHMRPLIVGVLTRFKPYRDFIAQVEQRGGIDGDLAFYLVQPKKVQRQTQESWDEQTKQKKIDEPLEALHAMKTTDWPFFAVFQKGLLRASAVAWHQFSVVGGSSDSTIDEFLDKWIAFLDVLSDRNLLKVKATFPKKDKDLIWTGISLNPASVTVRWSESAVQRIAGILVLWWYFYAGEKALVGRFLKKVYSPRGNEEFPKGKELAQAVTKALRPIVTPPDSELDDDEIEKLARKRLKDLIFLARNQEAKDEEGGEGDDDSDDDATDGPSMESSQSSDESTDEGTEEE
jgi:hypothetical protein